jgi:ribosomal protein S18 acetylase RimI-like enzyme
MPDLYFISVAFEDLMDLQSISRQTFYDTFSESNTEEDMKTYLNDQLSLDHLEREWKHPASHFYFVKYGKEILGYVKLNEKAAQTENREMDTIELERIYVRKEHQKNGVGQFLLNQSIEFTQNRSIHILWLGVWENNVGAIRFYERNGFHFFGKHTFLLGQDEQTDLLMELRLG